MSARAMRWALGVVLTSTGLVIAAAAAAMIMTYRYPDTEAAGDGRDVRVEIPKGAMLDEILRRLDEAEVVDSPTAFRAYVSWRGLSHRIRAGSYDMRTDMTPREVLKLLIRGGRAPQVRVTIPEGKNIVEIADILSKAKIAPRGALLAKMRDRELVSDLGIEADSIEGYLYPDTYLLRPGTPPEEVLRALHGRFREVTDRLFEDNGEALADLDQTLGFGRHEIVIMASIVEKETGQAEERPLVASVYLNRLRLPHHNPKLLEADPTIVYGCAVALVDSEACKKFTDRIRTAHLRDRDNPYNTYKHVGLPPGPIANPGKDAIDAVLNPAKTQYLYFVSRNNGTHHFSVTYAEHDRAVTRYQRRNRRPNAP